MRGEISDAPARKLLNPVELSSLKMLCRRGLRRSRSSRSTRLPVWAKAIAVLVETVVLPSAGRGDVKSTV